MAIASHPQASAHDATDGHEPADVLVVFGITGDLAKVMTFNSLYRLEQRGLLSCPIVGVAVDDWSVDDLRRRARTLDRRATGRGGLRAARGAHVLRPGRLRRSGDVRAGGRRGARRAQPRVLPRDPAVPVRHGGRRAGRRGPDPERPRRRREAVRPRRRVRAGAEHGDPRAHRRVAAVPDRPLPGEDGDRRDPLPPVREHDARAGLEPPARGLRADHDGRGLRRRGPRPLLRPGRRGPRRRRQPSDAGRRRRGDGAARQRQRARAQGRHVLASSRRCPTPTRATACAGSTTATARSTGSRRTPRPRRTWR